MALLDLLRLKPGSSAFIFLVFTTSISSALGCPVHCKCSGRSNFPSVRCFMMSSKSIPSAFPTKIFRLEVFDVQNLVFPKSFFQNLTVYVLEISQSLLKQGFLLPRKISTLKLEYNRLSEANVLEILRSNRSKTLLTLSLKNNQIKISDAFSSLLHSARNLISLTLSENEAPVINEKVFRNFVYLRHLELKSCGVTRIHANVFVQLRRLNTLLLSENKLVSLPEDVFKFAKELKTLDLSSNYLTVYPVIKGPLYMTFIDLSNNLITNISNILLTTVKKTASLLLQNNRISYLPKDIFRNFNVFFLLDLSYNRIVTLQYSTLQCSSIINLSANNISVIDTNVFWGCDTLFALYLNGNSITHLDNNLFKGLKLDRLLLHQNKFSALDRPFKGLQKSPKLLTLFDNDISTLINTTLGDLSGETKVYVSCDKLAYINAMDAARAHIYCSPSHKIELTQIDISLSKSLRYGGFECRDIVQVFGATTCHSCMAGHYNKGHNQCQECSRGGYYQDQIGQDHCKQCNKGQFVNYTAGKSEFDCQTCPAGTDPDRYASTRACFCSASFSRRHRFGHCTKCEEIGIVCKNDTKSLAPGFWWKWYNRPTFKKYSCFLANIANEGNDYDPTCNAFYEEMPQIHRCLLKKSCLGGIQASCQQNYTGILCSVCKQGFVKSKLGCLRCPLLSITILKILTVPIIVIILVLLLRYFGKIVTTLDRDGETSSNAPRRYLSDVLLSLIKILLSYYQLLAVVITILSDLPWPKLALEILDNIYRYAFEIFSFPLLKCINSKLELTAYQEMVTAISGVILLAVIHWLTFIIHGLISLRKEHVDYFKGRRRLAIIYARSLLIIYFIFYPSVCQKIFQIWPFNCRRICLDRKERVCEAYLRVDYRVMCPQSDPSTTVYMYIGYGAVIIPVAFPLVLLILLYCSHKGTQVDDEKIAAVITRFCYENYKPSYWYWEVMDLLKKMLFSVGFGLFGLDTKTTLAYLILISGLSIVCFAYFKPIQHKNELYLQFASALCLFSNLCLGVVLFLSSDEAETFQEKTVDNIGLASIFVVVNIAPVLLITFLLLRYLCRKCFVK